METGITFQAGSLLLEGLYERVSNTRAVVVTHPHPLYGGDMHNSVVEAVVRVYVQKGYSTLRFNFRGVGSSSGVHDKGVGEKEDVLAAVNFLLASGMSTIHLAGYSFGAWVNGRVDVLPGEVEAMVAVSPPVAFLDYAQVAASPRLRYTVSGKNDDYAPPELIDKYLASWNSVAQFDRIDNCDHFYSGRIPELQEALGAFLEKEPSK